MCLIYVNLVEKIEDIEDPQEAARTLAVLKRWIHGFSHSSRTRVSVKDFFYDPAERDSILKPVVFFQHCIEQDILQPYQSPSLTLCYPC